MLFLYFITGIRIQMFVSHDYCSISGLCSVTHIVIIVKCLLSVIVSSVAFIYFF